MEKLEKDLKFFTQKGIVFHSTTLVPEKNSEGEYVYSAEYPDKIVKKSLYYPKYRDGTLKTMYDVKKNASLVFMGEVYNLIGVDVDNKDDTVDKYEEISKKNDSFRKTLTIKTVNNGIHEYYRLDDNQKIRLKNFKASTGDFLGLNIDIKYNNQLLFGPAIFGDDNEFTYEIIKETEPNVLPDYLFNEILKHVIEPKPSEVKVKMEAKEKQSQQVNKGILINLVPEGIKLKKKFDSEKKRANDIQKAKDLINIVDADRFNDWDKWFKLGCCLHNIDNSLLDVWFEFSKKNLKFEEGKCELLWGKMRNEGYTIGSLIFWAQMDNPKRYKEYMYIKMLKYIQFSYSMTDLDIAYVFYRIEKYILKCAQEEPKHIWYILDEGIWQRLEGTSKIRILISKDLVAVYRDHLNYLHQKNLTVMTEIERNKLNGNIEIVNNIIIRLKTFNYVTTIIKQSVQFFKEDKFIEKLDNNPHIMCFGKNLFDLKTCAWRETLPNDYCSLKCGVDKNNINNKYVELLNKIFLDIFGTEERKEYMINCFSMFMNGDNSKQLFYVWCGKGANGKSVIQNYFKSSFGDYFCDLPSSLITEKEGKSGEANPELCRGRGKRIAFFAEPQENSKLNNSIIKKWSGGERISCRALYESPYQYDVLFKIIILCNTKFKLQDVNDDSIPRRCTYIDFKTKFDYNPQTSFQKLRNDKYGTSEHCEQIKGSFMFILLENYIRLKEKNFNFVMPVDMIKDKEEFINSQNEVKEFLKTECTKTDHETDYITAKELFRNFQDYAKMNNIKIYIKEKEFKERVMRELPFKERYQPTINGKKLNIFSLFTNIKLNVEEEINNLDD